MKKLDRHDDTTKFQRQLNAGSMTLAVLALLARLDRPMYGYEIAKVLAELAGGPLPTKQGTLYPILRSLERDRLLVSHVEPSDTGPPRRYYRITDLGREVLPARRRAWDYTRDFVEAVIEPESR